MKKLFTNDTFFLISTLIGVVGSLITAAAAYESYGFISNIPIYIVLAAVGTFAIYVSYQQHNKNVMKGLIGAVLAIYVVISLENITDVYYTADKYFGIAEVVFAFGIFLNHFAINSSRFSSPSRMKLNQALCVLISLLAIAWNLFWAKNSAEMLMKMAYVVYAVAKPCLCVSIVCIESRLDLYRKNRETAGWTQEQGYPEGYVHEFEKNQ